MEGGDGGGDSVPGADGSPETLQCWRCDKLYNTAFAGETCPFCGASARPVGRQAQVPGAGRDGHRVSRLIWGFVLLLLVSLIMPAAMPGASNDEVAADIGLAKKVLTVMSVAEIIDTFIVVAMLAAAARGLPMCLPGNRRLGWLLALPVLVAMLGFNFAYHAALLEYTGIEPVRDGVVTHRELFVWVLIVYCVQPAIVEELFFRYFCIGVFKPIMGRVGVVFVSSLMFGLAHLGGIATLPVYIVIGLGLGYLRLVSGSMAIPIVLHFLHNLVIVAVDLNAL